MQRNIFLFKSFKKLFKNQHGTRAFSLSELAPFQRLVLIDFEKIIDEYVSNGVVGNRKLIFK